MLKGKHDFRSDTITEPTEAMREAMRAAEVGDDGRGDDPTVNRLEWEAARRLGKEAGLLVPSGTMGNLVALLTHTQRGDEVIVESDAHIYRAEVGGLAAVAGLVCHRLPGRYGALDPDDVEAAIRPESPMSPRTALICLENTHNWAGGTVIPPEQMAAVAQVARRHGIPVHVDGARIFNASVALGVDVRTLATHADSITFCLSKGLSAPIGSVLVGSAPFIAKARRVRRLLGGGMRQAGVIAAAGLVALEQMVARLAEDHRHARQLAEGLAAIPGLKVDLASVQTNIVLVDVSGLGITPAEFVARMEQHNVYAYAFTRTQVRFVTHRHVGSEDVDAAVRAAVQVAAPFQAPRTQGA